MNRFNPAYLTAVASDLRSAVDVVKRVLAYCPATGVLPASLFRNFLARHLPPSVSLATGFIVFGKSISFEIPALVLDRSIPPLVTENDAMIVLPESVRAIIDVRGRLDDVRDLHEIADRLAEQLSLARQETNGRIWAGLFVIETGRLTADHVFDVLEDLHKAQKPSISLVTLGEDQFVRWQESATNGFGRGWHSFRHQGGASANFVAHLTEAISGPVGDPLSGAKHKASRSA